ncbi:hypothetical protein DITRI_Ditri19aG0110800 [Diplodiscus trichospermus]
MSKFKLGLQKGYTDVNAAEVLIFFITSGGIDAKQVTFRFLAVPTLSLAPHHTFALSSQIILGFVVVAGVSQIPSLTTCFLVNIRLRSQQDSRFSSEPYIGEAVYINQTSGSFVVPASYGFWDVVSVKKAIQLVAQTREIHSTDKENFAEKIANVLLNEVRTLRTEDNISVIFLDFDSRSRISCKVDSEYEFQVF